MSHQAHNLFRDTLPKMYSQHYHYLIWGTFGSGRTVKKLKWTIAANGHVDYPLLYSFIKKSFDFRASQSVIIMNNMESTKARHGLRHFYEKFNYVKCFH